MKKPDVFFDLEILVKKGSAQPGDKIRANENDAVRLVAGGYAKVLGEKGAAYIDSKLPKAKTAKPPKESTVGTRRDSDDAGKGAKK